MTRLLICFGCRWDDVSSVEVSEFEFQTGDGAAAKDDGRK